jgi:hypothetical protein
MTTPKLRDRLGASQLVFTQARGRDVVFWQSPRTRKQSRPNVRTPDRPGPGIKDLQIVVDSHEQYPNRFGTQQVSTVKRALPCGDYGVVVDRRPAGRRGGAPADLQVRWPNVPVVFCETRQLSEEWTYRFLAAAYAWIVTEHAALQRISPTTAAIITQTDQAPAAPAPSTAEVRAWARSVGLQGARSRPAPPRDLAGLARRQRAEPSLKRCRHGLRSRPDRKAHRSHETKCA